MTAAWRTPASPQILAHEVLTTAGLVPYLMATGSRGYHVVVPIRPVADFEEVRAVAYGLAEAMARRAPTG